MIQVIIYVAMKSECFNGEDIPQIHLCLAIDMCNQLSEVKKLEKKSPIGCTC